MVVAVAVTMAVTVAVAVTLTVAVAVVSQMADFLLEINEYLIFYIHFRTIYWKGIVLQLFLSNILKKKHSVGKH